MNEPVEGPTVIEYMRLFSDMEFEHVFTGVLEEFARRVMVTNQNNGWYDAERDLMTDCMLIVTEVAEAAECIRNDQMEDTYLIKKDAPNPPILEDMTVTRKSGAYELALEEGLRPKPIGFASELADILIRLVDTAKRTDTVLGRAAMEKLDYNATRGHRHGGKKV